MKKTTLFISLLFAFFALNSFSVKTAHTEVRLTLIQADGSELVKLLPAMKVLDWTVPIKKAEFLYNNEVKEVTGLLVIAPARGDAMIAQFKGNDGLAAVLENHAGKGKIQLGDRIILDNVEDVTDKRNFSPIIYAARE